MKTVLILIISTLCVLTSLMSQTQISENWDSGNSIPTSSSSAPTVPTDYSTGSGTWTLFRSYRHSSANYSAPYAIRLLKDTEVPTDTAYIITPTLNTVGTVSLYAYGSSAKPIFIYKSLDGGSTWTFVDSVITGAGTFVYRSITMNESGTSVKLKLQNGTGSVNDLNFDNIVITSYSNAPAITVSTGSLSDFGSIIGGNVSSSAHYTVSGQNLTTDIDVTAPSAYEVSTDNTNFTSSLTLTQSGGIVASTTIYVRFAPSSATGSITGNVTHASTGAETKNVAVSGTAITTEPTSQCGITFGTVTDNSIVVNFSGGNGTNRILVAREGSSISWTPTDGNTMSGVNSNFAAAADQETGNKVVYDGTGSTVTMTGLYQNTTYFVAVFEYNIGTNNSQNYYTISPGTGSQTTVAVATLFVIPSLLEFGSEIIDTISDERTYALSGTTLSPASGNITITAPTGFEISATSGFGFASSIQIPYSGGILGSTTIYVRFKPIAVQSYSGNVTNDGGGASTKNVDVTGYGMPPPGPNEFQAEDGILNSAYILSDYTGYTGSGYVDMADKTNSSIEFVFSRETASTDTITVHFANGGSSRALAVSLNDVSDGTLTFSGTGSWSNWSSVIKIMNLQAGINRLRFTLTTNGSGPNLDRLIVGGQAATAMYKLSLQKSGTGTVSASPSGTYYVAGTEVTLTATPSGGSVFHHWAGSEESTDNPFIVTMNSHMTEIAIIPPSPGFGYFPYESGPKGFAGVGALGYPDGTTGGAGEEAAIVYVTNSDSLSNILLRRVDANHTLNFPPLTIYVIGTLTTGSVFSEKIDVKDVYDISIIGVGVDATLSGFGFNVVRASNIIIRNLKIQNAPVDGIGIQADDTEESGHHIWVDHCTITNCGDEALSVTHTASYVTISWNHFYNQDKNSLAGHSDSQTSDVAMKITYHHNYFDSTGQRNPRVRFGKVHVFNNYYKKNYIYGISSNMEADVLVEGSYFTGLTLPMDTSRDGSPAGDVVERNNIFLSCGTPQTRGTAFDPTDYYAYTLDSASIIPDLVSAYAGSGKFDFSTGYITTTYALGVTAVNGSVIKNPSQARYDSGTTVQLTAVPNDGYQFVEWTGDLTGSVNPTSIIMTSEKNISAIFAADQYYITATAGANGSISPTGVVTVDHGDSARFTFTPVSGYHVDSVIVDGVHQGNPESYTFYNVTVSHTIRVTFAENPAGQYTLVVSATNGSVIKNPDQSYYSSGTTVRLTANPAAGFHFTNWSGGLNGSNNPDSIVMDGNKSVTAIFAPNTDVYSLPVSSSWNMVSLPCMVVDARKTTLFPTATSDAFAYDNQYMVEDTLKSGIGYWLKFGEAGTILIPGASMPIDTFEVVEGWNMVGSISGPVAVAGITSDPPGLVTSQFFSYEGAYVGADSIKPGKGYWVKATQTGSVILDASSEANPKNAVKIVIISETPPPPPDEIKTPAISGQPLEFLLSQNYPNPFNPSTSFTVAVPEQAYVDISVYDVLGKKVRTLLNEVKPAGYHTIEWNGLTDENRTASSGIYFVRILSGKFNAIQKIVMMK